MNQPGKIAMAVVLVSFCAAPAIAAAQNATKAASTLTPPMSFTDQQAHQYMMKRLGIEALRPGPSGNPNDPNHANYDEAKANPYPNLPDALTMNDGRKVTSAKVWWSERRPQIVKMYEQNVYGRVPKNIPKVT